MAAQPEFFLKNDLITLNYLWWTTSPYKIRYSTAEFFKTDQKTSQMILDGSCYSGTIFIFFFFYLFLLIFRKIILNYRKIIK
jgi:hypothetical protein